MEISATLSYVDSKSPALLELQLLSSSDLIKRRVKRIVLLLLAAALSAFLPILHLMLTPLLLLTTLIAAFLPVGPAAQIKSGAGSCPACGAPFRIMARRYSPNFSDVCEACHREIVVQSTLAIPRDQAAGHGTPNIS